MLEPVDGLTRVTDRSSTTIMSPALKRTPGAERGTTVDRGAPEGKLSPVDGCGGALGLTGTEALCCRGADDGGGSPSLGGPK